MSPTNASPLKSIRYRWTGGCCTWQSFTMHPLPSSLPLSSQLVGAASSLQTCRKRFRMQVQRCMSGWLHMFCLVVRPGTTYRRRNMGLLCLIMARDFLICPLRMLTTLVSMRQVLSSRCRADLPPYRTPLPCFFVISDPPQDRTISRLTETLISKDLATQRQARGSCHHRTEHSPCLN